MGEQQFEEESKELTEGGGKRKLEDPIELAKQKAQEIAARLVSDAAATADVDIKRPRLGSSDDVPSSLFSSSVPARPPSFPVPVAAQPSQYPGSQGTIKRISIPNGKVGVVIGKGGETIKYIQLQSGAKIQITKDQDADPHALTRDVELMGTSEQISRAEQLINDVIVETDAGGSAYSAVQGLNTNQSGMEQFSMKVANDKVGLLIGKGGETIKYMQNKSGARMQIIPLHLPPGDPSTERTIYLNGSAEQIEAAKELVNDVISGKRILTPSGANSYAQQAYPPGNWAQPGQPAMQQQPQYAYTQTGNHPTPYYGNYTQQPAWDQSNPSTVSQTPQQTAGYGYYGQPPMASAPLNASYGYSETHSVASNTYDQGYGQQPPSYGQNIPGQVPPQDQQRPYAPSAYGQTAVPSQPDGAITSQSTPAAPAYPPTAYSQAMTNPQTYWTPSTYPGQPPTQTGYAQTGYSQTAYGVQVPPPSTQPVYGQGGCPHQPTSAPANYAQGTYPASYGQLQLETQQQSQAEPVKNGYSQPLAYGAETVEENSKASHGSSPAVQESVPSQS